LREKTQANTLAYAYFSLIGLHLAGEYLEQR